MHINNGILKFTGNKWIPVDITDLVTGDRIKMINGGTIVKDRKGFSEWFVKNEAYRDDTGRYVISIMECDAPQ